MRVSSSVVLSLIWLFAAASGAIELLTGQSGSAEAETPASGVLQKPSGPPRDQPEKAPAAAPRQPVHKSVQAAGNEQAPVVAPHGQLHPRKPVAAGAAAKPPAALPAPASPAEPQADAVSVPAARSPEPGQPDGSAVKLPRFASLRSDDVNMRAGPGTRYRIDWVYKRRDLPVEIQREFDVWRWVRDADGIQGWVHQATLMARRDFLVQKADATLRSAASDSAPAVAVLKVGVIGRIRSCEAASDWCNVQTGSYRGYLRREQFWGTLPGEAVAP
jgi:SH3-like domain-containing protein